MKRILFIIPSLNTGGTNSSLSNIYSCIKDKCKVSIFSLSGNRNSEFVFDENVLPTYKFLTIFERSLENSNGVNKIIPLIIKSIIKVLSLFSIDLRIIVYKIYANIILKKNYYDYVIGFQEGTATKFASVIESKNKIAWVHCDYNHYLNKSQSELDIYKTFKQIICVSNFTSNVFKKRYPELAVKTSAIYNILDVKKIESKALAKIEDQRFSNEKFTFISAGRLVPIKGYDLIPGIASILKKNKLSFVWYIVGPQATKNYSDKILRLIKENMVEDCVFWLGNKSNPYPYIKASDAFVCTSVSEACPMVFCEAFTLGVPVITTNFGSASEFIKDSNYGLICTKETLASKMTEILTDSKLLYSLKENLKNYQSFNNQIKQDLLRIFEL